MKEGLTGLYKGYGATVLSFGPFSGLYFMFYEKIKLWLGYWNVYSAVMKLDKVDQSLLEKPMSEFPQWTQLGFFQAMGASCVAGVASAILTNPLDLAKLRL